MKSGKILLEYSASCHTSRLIDNLFLIPWSLDNNFPTQPAIHKNSCISNRLEINPTRPKIPKFNLPFGKILKIDMLKIFKVEQS